MLLGIKYSGFILEIQPSMFQKFKKNVIFKETD